jgi:hypothetical protein
MMVHYERARREMGIEVFHATGILESIIVLFKNITGIEPIPDARAMTLTKNSEALSFIRLYQLARISLLRVRVTSFSPV